MVAFCNLWSLAEAFVAVLQRILWRRLWFLWCLTILAKLGLRCGGLGFRAAVKGLGQAEMARMGTEVCNGGWVRRW